MTLLQINDRLIHGIHVGSKRCKIPAGTARVRRSTWNLTYPIVVTNISTYKLGHYRCFLSIIYNYDHGH